MIKFLLSLLPFIKIREDKKYQAMLDKQGYPSDCIFRTPEVTYPAGTCKCTKCSQLREQRDIKLNNLVFDKDLIPF